MNYPAIAALLDRRNGGRFTLAPDGSKHVAKQMYAAINLDHQLDLDQARHTG